MLNGDIHSATSHPQVAGETMTWAPSALVLPPKIWGGTHCWHCRTLLWKWWCLSDFDQLKNNKCTFFTTNDLVCRMCVYIYTYQLSNIFICTEAQSEVAQKSRHRINVKVQGSLQRFECKKINPRSLNILRQDWNGKKLKCQYQVRTPQKNIQHLKMPCFPNKKPEHHDNRGIETTSQQRRFDDFGGKRRGRKTQASDLPPRNIGPQGGASHK